tara:strand:+ start:710 stop:1006 length:297 start_codon:yes stop_codon:yes gene_type:complete
MIKPPIEELLEETPGRFALVITASRRARDINSYFNQLGEGIGAYTPPQVQSLSRKPLTVAFEEIAAGKVEVSKDGEVAIKDTKKIVKKKTVGDLGIDE